jgi:hypothetical protein
MTSMLPSANHCEARRGRLTLPLQGSERPGCITAICLFLAFAVFG